MRRPLWILFGLGIITACATGRYSDRQPQSLAAIPADADLFLTGTFGARIVDSDEKHYGEPLDLSNKRPPVSLTDTVFEKKYGRPGYLLIGNLYHRGHFYMARIPLKGVQQTYYQMAFDPNDPHPHSVLRFEFAAELPVQLVALMPDEHSLERLRDVHPEHLMASMPEEMTGDDTVLHNLSLTQEPLASKKDANPIFDPKRIDSGAYIAVLRLVSQEVRFEEFFTTGGPVSQTLLSTAAHSTAGDQILAEGLAKSQADGLRVPYNSSSNNGADVLLGLLDPALVKKAQVAQLRHRVLHPDGKYAERPMQLDRSLAEEAHLAFMDAVSVYHHELCPIFMSKPYCNNISRSLQYHHLREPSSVH